MEYRQIETFLQVVNSRSLTYAAEVMHVTQSTVSYRLKSLEDELGFILIRRKKGHQEIYITEMGEKFIPIAEEWMDLYHRTEELSLSAKDLVVRIVGTDSLNYRFTDIYKLLRDNESNVKLSIQTANSNQIERMVANHEADVGFLHLPCKSKSVICEELGGLDIIIMEKGPKRTSYPYIKPESLDESRVILLSGIGYENPATVELFTRWFGNTAKFKMKLDSASLLVRNMEEGDWCIITESAAEKFREEEGFNLYYVKEDSAKLPYYIVFNKDADKELKRVINKYYKIPSVK